MANDNELLNLIGAVDDGVVSIKGEVRQINESMKGIKKTVDEMDKRQRGNHDELTEVRANQNNCPIFKSKFNMNDPRVFITTVGGLLGLFTVLMKVL